MKKLIIAFALLVTCDGLFGQDLTHSFLTGHWKVVSADNGEGFMDFKNDSISLSEEYKHIYSDTSSIDVLKNMMRTLYAGIYVFDGDSLQVQVPGVNSIMTGTYQIDTSKELIGVTSKNSLGKNTTDSWRYFIKDDALVLIIELSDKPLRLTLEKR